MKKVIFFGTPDFSAKSLEFLINTEKYNVQAVISNPPAKIGRKQILTDSPVSLIAKKYNINLFNPENIKDEDFYNKIKSLEPDIAIVISYGKIMPQKILDIPKYGTFNLHFSLLPKWRGASPVQSAIKNNDLNSGITIFKLVEEMDAGDIAIKKSYNLENKTLPVALNEMTDLSLKEIEFLIDNIEKIKLTPQDHNKKTFCSKISKQDGEIFPEIENKTKILNKWRAYYTWPGIFLFDKNNKRIKLIEIKNTDNSTKKEKGEFFIENKKLYLSLIDGNIEIIELQKEGKKSQKGNDMINIFL